MRRLFLLFVAIAILWTVAPRPLLAQGVDVANYEIKDGWGGPGYYVSWPKVLACWLVFMCWVYTTDWVSRDAMLMRQDYLKWNPIVVGSFLLAMLLVWLGIPYFWLAFPLLLAAYVAPLATYIVLRNKQVAPHEKVLTRAHLRHWFSSRVATFGVKVEAEKKADYEKGPPLLLESRGAEQQQDQARLIAARQLPGFNLARKIMADGLDRRADTIVLDFTQQATAIRYQIDGVWHNGEPISREEGDPALEALKTVCGLKPADRQSKQEGLFVSKYKDQALQGTFASQGTKTGERVALQFEQEKVLFTSLDDLGMRAKMQEALREALGAEKGFVVLSAMPATGLRTSSNIVLRSQDRLMREFMGVEDERNRYEEIENIPITTYDGQKGESPADVLIKLFRLDPQVVVVRDLVDGRTVGMLCQEISEEKRVAVSTVRAKDGAEALLRVLALKPTAEEFPKYATAVLNQRLIRKLCDKCKQAYAPTPQVLKQLRIPEGRVQAFYRTPQPTAENPNPEPCEECGGIGYKGRTGLFEFWALDDSVRQVLAGTPKLDLLRQASRKAGNRSMQEEGVLLVAKGVTSLPELMRVLKL